MTESHAPLSDWSAVVQLVVDTLEQGWLHVSVTQQAVLITHVHLRRICRMLALGTLWAPGSSSRSRAAA